MSVTEPTSAPVSDAPAASPDPGAGEAPAATSTAPATPSTQPAPVDPPATVDGGGAPADPFDQLVADYESGNLDPAAGLRRAKELGRENQSLRQRVNALEGVAQAASALHPDDAGYVGTLTQAFASRDKDTAITLLLDGLKAIAGDQFDQIVAGQPAAEQSPETPAADRPIDEVVADAVAKALAAREQEATVEQTRSQVAAKMADLGYEPEADGSPSVVAEQVLMLAKRVQAAEGCTAVEAVEKAHAQVQDQIQAAAVAYAKSKGGLSAVDAGGEPKPAENPDLTGQGGVSEGHARALKRLAAMSEQQTA